MNINKILNAEQSTKRLQNDVCRYCGVCKADENGRIRKRNCWTMRHLKEILAILEELKKEQENEKC